MTETPVSLPEKLFRTTLNEIVDALGLIERRQQDGGPAMTLTSQIPGIESSVGAVRVFEGPQLFRLVACSITVEPMQLDSHMLFAFTPASSPVPHFTLDSVKAGDHFAFHLDLIPRLDLGANIDYLNEVYHPLTAAFEDARSIVGLSRAHLSPRQLAVMSPWMLAHRADESAFVDIDKTVKGYLHHWLHILKIGVSDCALNKTDENALRKRNLANKAIIFSPEIDPVWNRIEGLIGADAVAEQRALLLGEDE